MSFVLADSRISHYPKAIELCRILQEHPQVEERELQDTWMRESSIGLGIQRSGGAINFFFL